MKNVDQWRQKCRCHYRAVDTISGPKIKDMSKQNPSEAMGIMAHFPMAGTEPRGKGRQGRETEAALQVRIVAAVTRFFACGYGFALVLLSVFVTASGAAEAEVRVIASIKPVHSLVAAVMAGVGEPGLIVDSAASPHTYSLKPSQAAELEDATVIFWIGPELEAFLEKPVATIGANAVSVNLIEVVRPAGLRRPKDSNSADHDHNHDHGEFDAHIWLDPQIAKDIVLAIKAALVKADPANASAYGENAANALERLSALITEVQATLDPVKHKSFMVYHDAYRGFERRFGLTVAGSLTTNPEVKPGARRIDETRFKAREEGVVCVFTEPQFKTGLIPVITGGSIVQIGVMDPLGARLENGPDLYFDLIRNMADAIHGCLSAPG